MFEHTNIKKHSNYLKEIFIKLKYFVKNHNFPKQIEILEKETKWFRYSYKLKTILSN